MSHDHAQRRLSGGASEEKTATQSNPYRVPEGGSYATLQVEEGNGEDLAAGRSRKGFCARCCSLKGWLIYCLLCCSIPVLVLALTLAAGLAMGNAASSAADADLTPNFGAWEARDEEGYVQSVKEGGRWQNFWGKGKRPGGFEFFTSVLISGDDQSNIPSQEELDKTLPVKRPYWIENPSDAVGKPGIRATWIGHATVVAEVDSTVLITDPIFSQRASLTQWMGPKRYRQPACTVDELPSNLTAVVISHTHYDHLDYQSCRDLHARYGDKLHWFVPSGVGAWLQSNAGVSPGNTHDLVWWQEETLPGTETRFTLTPSNHWGRRGLFDEYKELWGSWAVSGPRHKFWFGGDTAYCEAFEQIGRKVGPFDLSAIPVGAYNPRWFMKWVHVDPEEAVRIHQDIRSKKSVGVHWGTFKLTFEHYLEPRAKTATAMAEKGLDVGDFAVVDMGETVEG